MKYFRLEAGEKLLTTNGKERPVILIRPAIDDWWNPPLSGTHEKYWLCLPLFSYKTRHNQDYVLRDQRLENDNSFFFPPIYGNRPAIAEESAVRFHAIQMIKERDIKPYKQYCSDPGVLMNKPVKLSDIGLRLLMYHFYKSLGIFSELNDPDAEYSLFKEQINILISAALKK